MSETITAEPTGAAPAAPTASAPVGGDAPADWRASLPDDLRGAAALGKYGSVADLAKGLLGAQDLIGRKGVIPPKDGDPPEVLAAYRAALGVPEAADGYGLKLPDGVAPEAWNADGVKAFAGWAHELGLTPAQASGIAERFAKAQHEALSKHGAGTDADGRPMEDVLRGEWGAQYDAKVDLAKRAARDFGADQGMLDALEAKVGGSGLVKFFAKIGEAMGEDRPAGMGATGGRPDPKAELADLTKRDGAYWDPLHPQHRVTYERVKALHSQMAG